MAAAVLTKKVKNYPAYTVSATGKVCSTWRSKVPVELTPQPDRDGRPFVGMFNDESKGKAFHASVARLVLETFVRAGKPGECAGYKDFNPKNCNKGNLFWTTRSEASKRKAKQAKRVAAKAGAFDQATVKLTPRKPVAPRLAGLGVSGPAKTAGKPTRGVSGKAGFTQKRKPTRAAA